MPPLLVSLALFAGAVIYAVFFFRALATGKASTRYQKQIDRARQPVAFWAAEALNAIFAIACVVGGILAWTAM